MYELRDYQKESVTKTIDTLKKSSQPILLNLPTGAGKSLIIAEIARYLSDVSNKKVLCLAPSKELVIQNFEKYTSYGKPASIYSASAGEKCTKYSVIFGSPQSVINSIDKFSDEFCAIIIDESHRISKTIKSIVNSIRIKNKNLRVIGLTATPYRLDCGYIYAIDENGFPTDTTKTKDPYFAKLVHSVSANYMIKNGYLTPPETTIHDVYDTDKLVIGSNKKFTSDSVDQVFVGKGRLTAEIVHQVVECSIYRKGVMFFASTVEHAYEILESLPPKKSRIITGNTSAIEREKIVREFKLQRFKYLVNVSVLTTGFDAPHVDCIAVLRATESASLFQQIIGRGLRLCEDKDNCLILDFAGNIKRHSLEEDLFNPALGNIGESAGLIINATCPKCKAVNKFSGRRNENKLKIDDEGYFLDLTGKRIIDYASGMPFPAHFGRRCNYHHLKDNDYVRCDGRWSFKVCPSCDKENDIASKRCINCKKELVNPNNKLEIKHTKNNVVTKIITNWNARKWTSKSGNECIRLDFTTTSGILPIWYMPNSIMPSNRMDWDALLSAIQYEGDDPSIDEFIEAFDGLKRPDNIIVIKRGSYYKPVLYNAPIKQNSCIGFWNG